MDVYQFIRNNIFNGNFKQGQRLTEEFLAEKLSVSRTPIREAINRLNSEGLLIIKNRKVTVRKFDNQDIRQIFDLRALIEGYAVGQAAIYRSEEQVNQLRHLNASFLDTIENFNGIDEQKLNDIVYYNNKIHSVLLHSSRNSYLLDLRSKVILLPLVYQSFYWYTKEEIIDSFKEHETIIKSIEYQDSERAKSAMREHIYRGRDHVLRNQK